MMNININNYEEWMIDYVEGNLTEAQRKQFAEFLTYHPGLKSELELFEQTKLQPDMQVVFAGKEKLMQKETARVITMGNWVKYTSAVAAALLLFVGIRFFTGGNNDQPVAIRQYHGQAIDTPMAFDRQTDEVKEKSATVEMGQHNDDQHYAQQEKKEKQPVKEDPAPMKLQREQIDAVSGIEFADAKPIRQQLDATIKDVLPDVVEIPEQQQFATNHQTDKSKNISLNDNNSIVDWMNDALAMGGEVEGMISSFVNDDKKSINSSPYKTTNVNILGINYYSRKKINN